MDRVLITGGAGFIGSHLSDELVTNGYRVRVLDALDPQVHPAPGPRPVHLHAQAEFVRGDVRDARTVEAALDGVDAVVHFAAAVGVGQSMYRIHHYVDANAGGTAVLLERLLAHAPRRLVVASSMSVYGEGLYRDLQGHPVADARRTREQLKRAQWDPTGPGGELLLPVPTPETKPPQLASVYALTKFDQERLCLIAGEAYNVPTVALRFFNTYGPRQTLGNPYTGVLAIFATRILNGHPPLVFEDGLQRRDFVSVYDVARACRLALESAEAPGNVFNVGSGEPRTILDVAHRLLAHLQRPDLEPVVAARYRAGDVRHCYADIERARELLGYRPQVPFDEGLRDFAQWLADQVPRDTVEDATTELETRGLLV